MLLSFLRKLRTPSRPIPAPFARTRLNVELLESRDCPALTLEAVVLPGHEVQLSGHYSGEDPENVTVVFSGAVTSFSTTLDANGAYSVTTSDAGLGTVYAEAFGGEGGSASDDIVVDSPELSVSITNVTATTVTVAGTLTDLDAEGRTVAARVRLCGSSPYLFRYP